MTLSKVALEQFKSIYLQEFNTQLNDEEALEKAKRVFSFYKTIIIELSKDLQLTNFPQKGGELINDNKDQSNAI